MQTQNPMREMLLTNAELAHDRSASRRYDCDEWKQDINFMSQREFEAKYGTAR